MIQQISVSKMLSKTDFNQSGHIKHSRNLSHTYITKHLARIPKCVKLNTESWNYVSISLDRLS